MNNKFCDQRSDSGFILENAEFNRLSRFIMSQYGIKLFENKKTLLQCRLQKRIRALNYGSFREYVDYVLSSKGQQEEVVKMVDAVTTNKTDFFREPVHYDFLFNKGLDHYLNISGKNKISIWSAGCSSGEEPYTLAMIINEFASQRRPIDFNILATDISESVLQHALVGIYSVEKTLPVPILFKQKYFLRGKSQFENKVRICKEMRDHIDFRKFNLITTDYKGLGQFDIIFCRNVLIYFERELQFRILRQFCNVLKPNGYLFLGHSETITGCDLPLEHIKPTIYSRNE